MHKGFSIYQWLALAGVFLAGMCVYPAVSVSTFAANATAGGNKWKYVGRTTLMIQSDQKAGPSISTATAAHLISSQSTFMGAASTLADLGLKSSPAEILGATQVTPVKDTNIVAIEVTLSDPREAKVTADIIAAEAKKQYDRVYGRNKNGESALKTVDPAYVRPVDRPNAAKRFCALIANPVGGLITGIISGLIIGLGLSGLIRNGKAAGNLAQETGV